MVAHWSLSFRLNLSCLIFLASVTAARAQNLVPNASFETALDFGRKDETGWSKLQDNDTPDYFNFNTENPHNKIFEVYRGGTNPRSGFGFAGIFCYRTYPERKIRNIREYIKTPLTECLEKDSLYKVEMSICLDRESNVALRNLGALLTDSPPTAISSAYLNYNKPQVEFTLNYPDNNDDWITISAFYKAKGNEKYLVIGNFTSDKSTVLKNVKPPQEKGKKSKWNLAATEKAAYYFIDDLAVEKISLHREDPVIESHAGNATFLLNTDDIRLDSAIVLKNIYFDFNTAVLIPESYLEINRLRELMITHPSIKIKLEGHTDIIGGYDFNLRLSFLRAEAVSKALIAGGVDPSRIEFAGLGYSHPVAPNVSEEGRQKNRRVVFKIIEK